MHTGAAQSLFSVSIEARDEGEFVSVTCLGTPGTQPIIVNVPSGVWRAFVRDVAAYWLVPEGIGGRRQLM